MKKLLFAAIAVTIISCSKTDPVERALIDYHKSSGMRVNIENLEYRRVPENWADSMRWVQVVDSAGILGKEYLHWLGLGAELTAAEYKAKYDQYHEKAQELKQVLKSSGRDSTMYRCRYTAHISGPENYRDTITAAIDLNMNVVWSSN